jgi:hypothetical protein
MDPLKLLPVDYPAKARPNVWPSIDAGSACAATPAPADDTDENRFIQSWTDEQRPAAVPGACVRPVHRYGAGHRRRIERTLARHVDPRRTPPIAQQLEVASDEATCRDPTERRAAPAERDSWAIRQIGPAYRVDGVREPMIDRQQREVECGRRRVVPRMRLDLTNAEANAVDRPSATEVVGADHSLDPSRILPGDTVRGGHDAVWSDQRSAAELAVEDVVEGRRRIDQRYDASNGPADLGALARNYGTQSDGDRDRQAGERNADEAVTHPRAECAARTGA